MLRERGFAPSPSRCGSPARVGSARTLLRKESRWGIASPRRWATVVGHEMTCGHLIAGCEPTAGLTICPHGQSQTSLGIGSLGGKHMPVIEYELISVRRLILQD